MRNQSHTLIATVRSAVTARKQEMNWSRESVVQEIVEAHERIGGPATTGIVFDPVTKDTFARGKVNADRVSRWLDDETKDNNFLPANFLPSILAALPMDLRLQCLGEILRPLGVEVRSSAAADGTTFDGHLHCGAIIKESSEAARALLAVVPGASMETLESARKEVQDAHEATGVALRAIDSKMNADAPRAVANLTRAA